MKTLRLLMLLTIIVPVFFSCSTKGAENKENSEIKVSNDIQVYYFHFTRRCATCNAVEEKTLEILKEKYSEELENGKITFTSLNLDENEAKEIAEKIGVSGQALVFIKGDKKVDLTSEGFMYARNNPEKLKEIITEKMDELMK